MLRKEMVVGILIMFIGTSMISSISGIIIEINDESGTLPNINQGYRGFFDYYQTNTLILVHNVKTL